MSIWSLRKRQRAGQFHCVREMTLTGDEDVPYQQAREKAQPNHHLRVRKRTPTYSGTGN